MLDFGFWQGLAAVVGTVLTFTFALWKGRQVNNEILIQNAERYLTQATQAQVENSRLNERLKRNEERTDAIEQRYERLMRRYVLQEDYLRAVTRLCEVRGVALPPMEEEEV